MARRGSEEMVRRRPSVPELMRRHSSLLASLSGDGLPAEGIRAESRRSTSALEREFPNLRATPRPSTCQSIMEEEPQSLSIEELEQLLENCTKLTRDNQLTEGRLWGLALPQHMPELAKQNADQASFNFQKVSFGLDAAVQIYSKRVDSMHNSALDTRSRLTHQQKNEETSTEDEQVEMSARRRIRRLSDFGGDSTLVSNLETITTKAEAEETSPLDPLFHKTSALFDARGFKGLPSLNLGIKNGGRYVLDMSEVPDQTVHRGYDLPQGHKLDLSLFGTSFEPTHEMKQLSQSSMKLYRMLDRPESNHSIRELIRRGMNAVTLLPRPQHPDENEQQQDDVDGHNRENGAMNRVSLSLDDADAAEFPQDDNPFDFPDVDGDDVDHRNPSLPPPQCDGVDGEGHVQVDRDAADFNFDLGPDTAAISAAVDVDLLDEDTISWLLDPNPDRNHARTGASHWKYPQASTNAPTETERSPQQRRREAKEDIDFTNLPEIDLSKFKKAPKASSITAQFKDEATHLQPIDHGYDASFLLQLPLMPSKKPQEWLRGRRLQSHVLPANDDPMGFFDDCDDFPEADVGHGGGFEAVDDILYFGLVEAPPQIEEDSVQVETMPSRVDMGQIKTALWRRIEDLGREDGSRDGIPFDAFVDDATQRVDVSFGICFACSLHLAVERNFEIVNTSEGGASIMLSRQE